MLKQASNARITPQGSWSMVASRSRVWARVGKKLGLGQGEAKAEVDIVPPFLAGEGSGSL